MITVIIQKESLVAKFSSWESLRNILFCSESFLKIVLKGRDFPVLSIYTTNHAIFFSLIANIVANLGNLSQDFGIL